MKKIQKIKFSVLYLYSSIQTFFKKTYKKIAKVLGKWK